MVEETCSHLKNAKKDIKPKTPEGCEECLAIKNKSWNHLRICLTCGHVGCCDSSIYRHATNHFKETNHPVMKSFEKGQDWKWCYVDELTEE